MDLGSLLDKRLGCGSRNRSRGSKDWCWGSTGCRSLNDDRSRGGLLNDRSLHDLRSLKYGLLGWNSWLDDGLCC